MGHSIGQLGGRRTHGCCWTLDLFLLLTFLAAAAVTHSVARSPPNYLPKCTRTLCTGVASVAHPRLQPWTTGPPTTVDVPLHLAWPARRSGLVPLVILLHGALVRSSDYAGLVSTLGRQAVVAAPEYSARNFTLPPGVPSAGPIFDTFLDTIATKGKRPECPSQGVLPSSRLVQSVLDAFSAAARAAPGTSRPHPALARAVAAADRRKLVLFGHSAGAAAALTLATGQCASSVLSPLQVRISCEGASTPPADLAGVVWYSGTVGPQDTVAKLPPGVWGLGIGGGTPAEKRLLANVTGALAPAPGGNGYGVLLTAVAVGAGHYGVAGVRRTCVPRAPAGQRGPAGGPPLCAAPNAGDANFTTTPSKAAAVVRLVADTTAAAMDAYLAYPVRPEAGKGARLEAARRRSRGCSYLSAMVKGSLPGLERITVKGTPKAAGCRGVVGK
ncbi:hypothetical protein MMPV_005609 [Pyropia vietnamensis]